MNLKPKLKYEIKALGLAMLYFTSWIAALILLKQLVLAEYHIAFHGLSMALIGALILAKVVLILEHVSLGSWVQGLPAWIHVVLRTALYSFGVVIVLLLEKGFEGWREHGGFGPALTAVYRSSDAARCLAITHSRSFANTWAMACC
jgi:branched-subunit amino acid ABC-type transport system permease component